MEDPLDLAWEELAKPLRSSSPEFRQIALGIIKAHKLSVPVPGGRIRTEPPARTEPWRPRGFYYAFCTHRVPYWRTCSGCKRDKGMAARHASLMGPLIAALAAAKKP